VTYGGDGASPVRADGSATPGNRTLTAVPGICVGHAQTVDGASGCTVVIGPFRGAVDVSGMSTGSRELHVLDVEHMVPLVTAILLTGGSAFGLAAADGATAWLADHDLGHDTGALLVPIVPAAVIFDLRPGRSRPGPETGRAACEAASSAPVALGRVGAATSATVGNLAGPQGTMWGGLGSAALSLGEFTVGALAVVNALGDVLDGSGRIVAGAKAEDGSFLDSARLLREWPVEQLRDGSFRTSLREGALRPGRNTTLAVVATDAPLSRVDLRRLARIAGTALPRRISPVHTPFDGDVLFALSTAPEPRAVLGPELAALGVTARDALEEAITSAVTQGEKG
jgi:L-aminopeptidase/D-esterase-like protein